MRRFLPALSVLLLACPAPAEELTVYRCTDANGHVALRDSPCPDGQREQTRDMQRPTDPPPAPVILTHEPTPAPHPTPSQQTRVVFVEPPRPLYQCTTPEGERYTSDDADGNPRWVPLWTLGYPAVWPRNPLGDRVGAPRPEPPSDGPGAPDRPTTIGLTYAPGTWVRDRCVRVPPAQACELLRAEQRALRKEWFNAMPSRRAEVTKEEQALAARVGRTCSG